MKNILYGIDFGTSNSAVSIIDLDSNRILKTFSIPSVLYFPQKEYSYDKTKVLTGFHAIEKYVNDGMKGRFMKSIKRVLSNTSFQFTVINGQRYEVSDLVALILKDLKKMADDFVGETIDKVILGRPVFFDDHDTAKDALAQKRLNIAAKEVGFKTVFFQYEPIAAAFTYEKLIDKKQNVLVADLGGGTSDFTYIALDPSRLNHVDRRKDILATGGIYIGGDAFDSSFMWQKGTPKFGRGVKYESKPGNWLNLPLSLFLNITTWEKMIFFNSTKVMVDLKKFYFLSKSNAFIKNLMTLIEKNLGYSIFKEIEKVKIELSNNETSDFCFQKEDIDILESVSRNEYDEIIGTDLGKIEKYLSNFLVEKSIDINELDSVFMTGGTSMVPAVRELFEKYFGKEKIKSGDNFISVANGLAYSHYLLDDEKFDN